jgi:hypothetical protein
VRSGHAWAANFHAAWRARPFIGEGEALFLAWDGKPRDGKRLLAMAAISADPFVDDATTGRLRFIYMFDRRPVGEASPIDWSGTAWRLPGGVGGRFACIPIMLSRLDYSSAMASSRPRLIHVRRTPWLLVGRNRRRRSGEPGGNPFPPRAGLSGETFCATLTSLRREFCNL